MSKSFDERSEQSRKKHEVRKKTYTVEVKHWNMECAPHSVTSDVLLASTQQETC